MVSEFKAGDVVQLKSGGPKMTIDKLVTWQGVASAACDWFVGSARATERNLSINVLEGGPRIGSRRCGQSIWPRHRLVLSG